MTLKVRVHSLEAQQDQVSEIAQLDHFLALGFARLWRRDAEIDLADQVQFLLKLKEDVLVDFYLVVEVIQVQLILRGHVAHFLLKLLAVGAGSLLLGVLAGSSRLSHRASF